MQSGKISQLFRATLLYIADLMDSNGDIIDDKQVSAETCESLMGLPIAQLIAEGRAKLAAELDLDRE
ncbi:hypothetical protein FICKIIDM_04495 (plasmid) [Xanthomonas citri pv. punicae]|nr:hypothetical protein FICKIIDM_04495 [Xanthomonas citri pv. punicae]